MDEEDFQFGPWLRVVGPKTNRGKQASDQPKSNDGVEEEILDLEVEDDERHSSPNRPQMIRTSPVGKLSSNTTVSQVDDSRKTRKTSIFRFT